MECGECALDYHTLDERSDRFAHALIGARLTPAARVAILAKTRVEFFEFLVGAMKAGMVPVPVNWRLAPPEIAAILRDSGAVLLAVSGEFTDGIESIDAELGGVSWIMTLDDNARYPLFADWINEKASHSSDVLPSTGGEIALQIYTSGTTGRPKGVMTSKAALLSYLRSLSDVARFEEDSISLSTLPLFHIGGTGWALAGLYRGASVLLLPNADPDLILETVSARGVTNLIAVPSMVQMLLDSPRISVTDFSALRYLYYGGGPMPEHVLRRAIDAFDCAFIQGFGMTECPLISALEPEYHATGLALLGSCGRPILDTVVRLVDPNTGIDVAPGAVGEIWVRSPQNFAGYWNQPKTSADTLVEGLWLRTGDAARRDSNGFLFLQDRIKDMIVSGGENVYSAEVENVLICHSAVSECAVIGVPSVRWTETVKAIVVLKPGSSLSDIELIAFSRSRLASYKCPTSIDFIDSLPRTPSGKVIKFALRERYVGRE